MKCDKCGGDVSPHDGMTTQGLANYGPKVTAICQSVSEDAPQSVVVALEDGRILETTWSDSRWTEWKPLPTIPHAPRGLPPKPNLVELWDRVAYCFTKRQAQALFVDQPRVAEELQIAHAQVQNIFREFGIDSK